MEPTCNDVLVSHHTFQMSWAQSVKRLISGSKQSVVAGPAQFVHRTGRQSCSLGGGT